MAILSYAAITPARNEAENLRRLAGTFISQTQRPEAWIIVDNGSDDDTVAVAEQLASAHPWVRLIHVSGEQDAVPGAPIVRAFHAGLRELGSPPEVVIKLDADVSAADDYFELLVVAFDEDEALGIASGVCLEQQDGMWRSTSVTGDHVRGATRAYRWKCLSELLPLEERMGWDGLDELKAAVLGWRTRIVPELAFYHHRAVGERDRGRTGRWREQGKAAHYMGYRFSYLALRTLHRMRHDPAAVAMLTSYVAAALRREPRYGDQRVREYLRSQQSVKRLPLRVREALGRK